MSKSNSKNNSNNNSNNNSKNNSKNNSNSFLLSENQNPEIQRRIEGIADSDTLRVS